MLINPLQVVKNMKKIYIISETHPDNLVFSGYKERAMDILKKEKEILKELSNYGRINIYVEGTGAPKISMSILKNYVKSQGIDAEIYYLDQERPRIFRSKEELQRGREDDWVDLILRNGTNDNEIVCAIVGKNHLRYTSSNKLKKIIYKVLGLVDWKYRHIGYFGEKLRESGFELELFEV
jgi:hypothetical protein